MSDRDLREQFDILLRPIREATPPGLAQIRRRARHRAWAAAAASLAAVVALAGVAVAFYLVAVERPAAAPQGGTSPAPSASTSAKTSRIAGGYQSTSAFTVSAAAGRVGTLVVRDDVGQVTVTGGSGSAIAVTQRLRYSRTPPTARHAVTGRTLTLTATCPAERMCTTSYVVRVPRGISVEIRTSTGAIRLYGLAGPVDATAGIGEVFARGLAGRTVVLGTGTGEVNASFASPPAVLRATATTGEVALGLPRGTSYRVSAQTGLGETTVKVPESPSSAYSIVVRVGTGAIVIAVGS